MQEEEEQHTVAADIAVPACIADTAEMLADIAAADIVADIRSRWVDNYSVEDSSAAADNSVTADDRMLSEHPTASHRIRACVSAPLWCIQSGCPQGSHCPEPDRSLS